MSARKSAKSAAQVEPAEIRFVDECKHAQDVIRGKAHPVNPYRALYPLRIVIQLLPYEKITIQKFAYGLIPGSPISFFRDKKGRVFVPRSELVRYFSEAEKITVQS